MYKVPDIFIAQWSVNGDRVQLPASVDLICPYCGRQVTFPLGWGGFNNNIMNTVSVCPGCRKSPTFILVEFRQVADNKRQGDLYVYPAPKVRNPIEGIEDVEQFSQGLLKSYKSTLEAYNVTHWNSAAVQCRRLLEGITQQILPEEDRKINLYKRIPKLPEYIDLKIPIVSIAHFIRKLGNLGAHYDSEREPDEQIVTQMLDLLDYFLEYLFILPNRISHLDEALENLGTDEDDAAD